jgi:transposase-like protein
MEAITTEVITGEKKRDARGHRLYDRERKERILEGYDKSGLTQKAYARKEGIKYSTLVYWLQNWRRGPQVVKRSRIKFTELSVPTAATGCRLEVVLSDGTLVRGSDARELAALVSFLRA